MMKTLRAKIHWKLKRMIFGEPSPPKSLLEVNLKEQFTQIQAQQKSGEGVENKYGNVLMFPLVAKNEVFLIREGLIGYGLKMRGARVSYVLCDAVLTACISKFDELGRKPDCENCFQGGKIQYDQFGLDSILLGTYVDDLKKAELQEWARSCPKEELFKVKHAGIDIGKYVYSSVVRRAFTSVIDLNNPVLESKARDFLYATLILTEACIKIFEELRPDKIFISHGIYMWGPVFDLAIAKGIAIDTFGRAYRKDALKLFHNEPCAPYPLGSWNKYKSTHLTNRENQLLDEYFLTRATQKEDNIQLFANSDVDLDSEPGFVEWLNSETPEGTKLFGMFTNCDWDAAEMSKGGKFESMMSWITETVDFFIKHSEHKLLLKTHPAELLGNMSTPEQYRVLTFLKAKYETLPSNIFVLPPESTIKPFDIYGFLDFGLIHTSTVSIEMAFNGITVLSSGGGGHYSDKGFTIDPGSKEDYFVQLTSLMNGDQNFKPDIEAARRYMFYRFFRECVPSEKISMKHWGSDFSKMPPLSDLQPGKNVGVDIICEGILNDTEFVYDYN